MKTKNYNDSFTVTLYNVMAILNDYVDAIQEDDVEDIYWILERMEGDTELLLKLVKTWKEKMVWDWSNTKIAASLKENYDG